MLALLGSAVWYIDSRRDTHESGRRRLTYPAVPCTISLSISVFQQARDIEPLRILGVSCSKGLLPHNVDGQADG